MTITEKNQDSIAIDCKKKKKKVRVKDLVLFYLCIFCSCMVIILFYSFHLLG